MGERIAVSGDLIVKDGVVVDFETRQQMPIVVHRPGNFSQYDAAWKDHQLGWPEAGETSTIGEYGCLSTNVANVLVGLGIDTDPARLNAGLMSLGRGKGYTTRQDGTGNCNNLVFAGPPTLHPKVRLMLAHDCPGSPAPMETIDRFLEGNMNVIVRLDAQPKTAVLDEHWVTLVGKRADGRYMMHDPASSNTDLCATYGQAYGGEWTAARLILYVLVYGRAV